MKIENNNVKIEITETKDDKICIDITTSKEVVVNVKKEKSKGNDRPVLIGNKFRLVDVVIRGDLDENSDNNGFFDLTDIVKRGESNATVDLIDIEKRKLQN